MLSRDRFIRFSKLIVGAKSYEASCDTGGLLLSNYWNWSCIVYCFEASANRQRDQDWSAILNLDLSHKFLLIERYKIQERLLGESISFVMKS